MQSDIYIKLKSHPKDALLLGFSTHPNQCLPAASVYIICYYAGRVAINHFKAI